MTHLRKFRTLAALVLALAVLVAGCFQFGRSAKIERRPIAASINRGTLRVLKSYDPANAADPWQVDLRGYDLSSLDVRERLKDLTYATFDAGTKWPAALPEGFNPDLIMQVGKNPGLGVNSLHIKGITGRGVGLAVIDQPLLTEHVEYKDRLKLYEEIHIPAYSAAQMHGPAVASIAVGKTVGVAPGADLYYIAEYHGDFVKSGFNWDFTWLAKSIDRILEVNKTLPVKRKIRVISISVGWSPEAKGYAEVVEAVNRAREAGLFVVSSSLYQTYGFYFHGLGRDPGADPEKAASYEAGLWWANTAYSGTWSSRLNEAGFGEDQILLVPMDSRTTASPTGAEDYVFYRSGGWSWSIPYIAGVYALACQVKPSITPETFWKAALATADPLEVTKDGKTFRLGRVVNPVKLIDSLKR